VHLRFKNKAICAMADGHVERLGYDELLDMTRWANPAAQVNNPEWTVSANQSL
jgi:prepilin-type processing-associated H-X9-DG protein